jgi:hypothetical protein
MQLLSSVACGRQLCPFPWWLHLVLSITQPDVNDLPWKLVRANCLNSDQSKSHGDFSLGTSEFTPSPNVFFSLHLTSRSACCSLHYTPPHGTCYVQFSMKQACSQTAAGNYLHFFPQTWKIWNVLDVHDFTLKKDSSYCSSWHSCRWPVLQQMRSVPSWVHTARTQKGQPAHACWAVQRKKPALKASCNLSSHRPKRRVDYFHLNLAWHQHFLNLWSGCHGSCCQFLITHLEAWDSSKALIAKATPERERVALGAAAGSIQGPEASLDGSKCSLWNLWTRREWVTAGRCAAAWEDYFAPK